MNNPPLIALSAGEKTKAKDILAAIRTLKRIDREQRAASPDDRQVLARFGGFGPVALSLFPHALTGQYKDESWKVLGEELKSLLTPEEYDSAKRTTFNAFYTSPTVIQAMHQALGRLGVPANATVLEPGCGSGNFMAAAPTGMRFVGVEMDKISGRITQLRHPGQDIRIENFRDSRVPQLDAVIGNVPFADVKLEYAGQKWSLHDYFCAKSVDSLKPGGVLAIVTTHYTLDKQNALIREYLADKADFLGAIRLPSTAFKNEGTAVVTDILFLRRRAPGESANHADPDWLRTTPLMIEGAEFPINQYFLNHPEQVLGTWSRKDTLYGESYSVADNGNLDTQLKAAVSRLPEFAPPQSVAQTESPKAFVPPPMERHISEGSFFVSDGRIYQMVDGQSVPAVYGGSPIRTNGMVTGKRMSHLIGLRDKARRVLQSQNEGWPEDARATARSDLNWAYDRFVSIYGPINKTTFSETKDGTVIRRMPNVALFKQDPDAMLVMALEEYDEITGKAKKAAIMDRDVVGKQPPITNVSSAEEGLLVSLDRHGTVDLPFISQLYSKPEETVISELGDLIFRNPESKEWQTADAYLSGNVRTKLKVAEAAGTEYTRNAQALRDVQPEDVLPGDIDANLGAPWLPESDIQAFAAELFQVDSSTIQVAHVKKDAV